MTTERCPTCGGEPGDNTLHLDDCPRIGTCGQYGPPWLDEPWHPEDPPLRSIRDFPGMSVDQWDEQYAKPWRKGLRDHRREHGVTVSVTA